MQVLCTAPAERAQADRQTLTRRLRSRRTRPDPLALHEPGTATGKIFVDATQDRDRVLLVLAVIDERGDAGGDVVANDEHLACEVLIGADLVVRDRHDHRPLSLI
ncbi:hypothetical protein DC31_13890 [Microbacterium sp. CH12i]|nr:hypothetical protein DC31_13890 [Microbacterium sp. CH12i]